MALDRQGECPECGVSWDGGCIFETCIAENNWQEHHDTEQAYIAHLKEFYSPPYRWGRMIGIQLGYDHPNHYDGVSYWQCPDCKATWNRFTEELEEIPRHVKD